MDLQAVADVAPAGVVVGGVGALVGGVGALVGGVRTEVVSRPIAVIAAAGIGQRGRQPACEVDGVYQPGRLHAGKHLHSQHLAWPQFCLVYIVRLSADSTKAKQPTGGISSVTSLQDCL